MQFVQVPLDDLIFCFADLPAMDDSASAVAGVFFKLLTARRGSQI